MKKWSKLGKLPQMVMATGSHPWLSQGIEVEKDNANLINTTTEKSTCQKDKWQQQLTMRDDPYFIELPW